MMLSLSNVKNPSVLFFLALTTNDRRGIEQLQPLLQPYDIHFTRLTTQMKKDLVGVAAHLATKASFVAWTPKDLSHKELVFLSQVLRTKVMLLASFYEGQIWSVARLQEITRKEGQMISAWTSLQKTVF